MFEKASRLKLRFATPKGYLSLEDLWDLPLVSNNPSVPTPAHRPNLDDLARELHRRLQDTAGMSFVNPEAKPDDTTQLMFDLVKHIIDVKIAEGKALLDARERSERKQKIMSIIAERRDQTLREMPIDELEKLVNAL